MKNRLELTQEAQESLDQLQKLNPKKYRKVLKTLGLMENNLRHKSLQTHIYYGSEGPNGEKVFESYVENKTPGAYRIFWYYSSKERRVIVINAIIPHP